MTRKFLDPETPIVFLALYWAGPDAVSLPDLLFTFDYLNRATLTRKETEDHLNTLLSAGLLDVRPNFVYGLPRMVYDEFDQFRRRRRKDRFDDARVFVRRRTWEHPAPQVIQIPNAVFERAQYMNRKRFAEA